MCCSSSVDPAKDGVSKTGNVCVDQRRNDYFHFGYGPHCGRAHGLGQSFRLGARPKYIEGEDWGGQHKAGASKSPRPFLRTRHERSLAPVSHGVLRTKRRAMDILGVGLTRDAGRVLESIAEEILNKEPFDSNVVVF